MQQTLTNSTSQLARVAHIHSMKRSLFLLGSSSRFLFLCAYLILSLQNLNHFLPLQNTLSCTILFWTHLFLQKFFFSSIWLKPFRTISQHDVTLFSSSQSTSTLKLSQWSISTMFFAGCMFKSTYFRTVVIVTFFLLSLDLGNDTESGSKSIVLFSATFCCIAIMTNI